MSGNSQKVSDLNCPVKHFSDTEFTEFKKNPFAFWNLLHEMQQNDAKGMGFKITLETPLIHKSFDEMMSSQDWVDEIDIIEYYEKNEPDGLLAAERKFFDDQNDRTAVWEYKNGKNDISTYIRKDDKRGGKFRVLNEMIKYKDPLNMEYIMQEPIQVDLTLKNIDKLATHLSEKVNFQQEITENSLITEVDDLINAIRKSTTINVPNINLTPDLISNVDNPFNPWSLLTPMRKVPNEAKVAGVTSPYVYYSARFSHTCYHIEDSSLGSLNANFGPNSNAWIMVNEKFLPMMTEALRKDFKDEFCNCPGFIRSKAYLLTCAWFKAKKIPFKITIQKAGDIMITPANCIHLVICLGRCFKIAVNFMDPRWFALNTEELYICSGKHKSRRNKKPWAHGSMPRSNENQFNSVEILSLWGSYVAEIKKKQASGNEITVTPDSIVACSSFSSSSCSIAHFNNDDGDNSDNSIDDSDIVSCSPEVSVTVTVGSIKKRTRRLCSLCPKSFSNNARLKGHFQRNHVGHSLPESAILSKPKTKVCPVCTKVYSDDSVLIRHIKQLHSFTAVPQKRKRSEELSDRFHCTVCNKNYATKQVLQRHMDKIHS